MEHWYESVEKSNRFNVGDWVWHEEQNKPFQITDDTANMGPLHTTIGAVNEYTNTYIRLARPTEVERYKLTPFLNGKLLVGLNEQYYLKGYWRRITGFIAMTSNYISCSNYYTNICTVDNDDDIVDIYSIRSMGLYIPELSLSISHKEIMQIGKILKLR